MVKIVEKPVKNPKTGKVLDHRERWVGRSSDNGRFMDLHTVNADSKTFASDLGKAFRKNVKTVLRKKK
jgi:hypothetical protein